MKRLLLILCCLVSLPSLAHNHETHAASADMLPAPKVIFFDVNETLLDLTAMRSSTSGAVCGGTNTRLKRWVLAA